MSRVAKLPVDAWDPELRKMAAADSATELERGALRMMAHCPESAKGFVTFFAAMKRTRTLPERLVELVRLRIASHNQCRSCMAIRYRDAVEDGVTEELVCALERAAIADDLTDAEKAAVGYADLFAIDHLAINDATYDGLRKHFSEAQLVELGMFVAVCVGFGRLGATWDMVEELPEAFRDRSAARITPSSGAPIVVR